MLIALLLASWQPTLPPAGEAPVPREAHVFSDWVVACDNTRRCQAVGLVPEGQAEGFNGVLMVERGPEPDAQLGLTLSQVEGTPARLAVWSETVAAELIAEGDDYRIELRDRHRFLSSAVHADEIVLHDASGGAMGKISLEGLSSALLYMDEAQGRLHTRTALVRTGRRPATDVPSAPIVPVVRVAPATSEVALAIPAGRIARLRRESGCAIGEVGGPDQVEIAALGGGRSLLLLSCGSGAYNVSIVPFVATRHGRDFRIEPAPFDTPLEQYEEEEGNRILVNGAWDPAEMTLSDFSRGRGFGDCGSRSSYGWDGSRFRLVAREVMPECRGSWIFVTTWRAEVTR